MLGWHDKVYTQLSNTPCRVKYVHALEKQRTLSLSRCSVDSAMHVQRTRYTASIKAHSFLMGGNGGMDKKKPA